MEIDSLRISDINEQFIVTNDKLKEVITELRLAIKNGLQKDGNAQNDASLPMLESYIYGVPSGQEKGRFLSIDIGGTNVRVAYIELLGDRNAQIAALRSKVIPDELKKGDHGSVLFDFIANETLTFLEEVASNEGQIDKWWERKDVTMPLGFTFSFPINQCALDCGKIMEWHKGFYYPDIIGKDAVVLVNEAFERAGINGIRTACIVNDTVAALAASIYLFPDTRVGVILGTGTNAAYIENIHRLPLSNSDDNKLTLINTEWGSFDVDRVVKRTKWESDLDGKSGQPGRMHFEKMVSGKYLGEIFRLILRDLIGNSRVDSIFPAYHLDTSILTDLISGSCQWFGPPESNGCSNLLKLLQELNMNEDQSIQVHDQVRSIAEAIMTRSARLAAAAIVALCGHVNDGMDALEKDLPIRVAIDGALYKYSSDFREIMDATINELLGPQSPINIIVEMSHSNSSIGAAVVSAQKLCRM